MAFRQFIKLLTKNNDLNRVQDNIAAFSSQVVANTRLDSQTLTGVKLAAGTLNTISHQLGRKLVDFAIVQQAGPSVIWSVQSTNKSPELTLTIYSTNAITVDLECW